jgi:hypothetical protein
MLEFKYYKEHPTDFNRIIFYFFNKEQSCHFEILANENNIAFVKGEEPFNSKRYKTNTIYYFIVKKTDFDKVNKLSLLTYAKFRKPFIADKYFRYFIIILFLAMLFLSIIGILLSA